VSILRRLEQRAATLPESLLLSGMNRGTAYAAVGPDQAMRLQAVWSCVNLIADLIATLPVESIRTMPDRTKIAMSPQPMLIASPSAEIDAINWRRQVLMSWLLRGNVYGDVVTVDRAGWPTQIEILNPDMVACQRVNGEWKWSVNGKPVSRWPLGNLWHVPAYTVPGHPCGLSPISYAAHTIGLGLGARDFGAAWFDSNATPSAILESDQTIDAEQARIAKRRFKEAARDREVVAMGIGLRYKAISVNADESQFLATINANAAQIAGFFGLRPDDVNASMPSGSITYQNVEQQQLARLVYPMGPWMARLDAALTALLPRPQKAVIDTDALTRADLLTRYKAHDLSIRSGMSSPDERRAMEDEPPIPDGKGAVWLWPPFAIALPNTTDAGMSANADTDPSLVLAAEVSAAVRALGQREPTVVNVSPAAVTVQAAAAPPPNVNIDVQPSAAPNVTVQAPPAANVHVEAARAPNVTVTAPPPAAVTVNVPEPRTVTKTVERDQNGNISRIREE
jgi:HK97 family phage portal protein